MATEGGSLNTQIGCDPCPTVEELGNPGEPSWETWSGWAGTRHFLEETCSTTLLIPSPVQFSNPSSLTNYSDKQSSFTKKIQRLPVYPLPLLTGQ